MARPNDTQQQRDQYVRTRVTKTEKALIDEMRASASESNFVRDLIAAEAQRRGLTG